LAIGKIESQLHLNLITHTRPENVRIIKHMHTCINLDLGPVLGNLSALLNQS